MTAAAVAAAVAAAAEAGAGPGQTSESLECTCQATLPTPGLAHRPAPGPFMPLRAWAASSCLLPQRSQDQGQT